jgi:hypothetical protein
MSDKIVLGNSPNLSTEHHKNETKYWEAHYYTHMSETQAQSEIAVSKNTYAVPARHETYRFCGTLALVAVLLYFVVPVFLSSNPDSKTLAYLIGVIVALVAGPSAIKAIVEAFKSGGS